MHGVQRMFVLPYLFVPNILTVRQSDDALKLIFDFFHLVSTSFVYASIYPNLIFVEK